MDVEETSCYVVLNGKKNPYMRLTIPGLDEEIKYFKFRDHDFNDYTCLLFQNSWEWLVPVIAKCYRTNVTLFVTSGLWSALLESDSKLRTWNAIINFIKTNKNEIQRSNSR